MTLDVTNQASEAAQLRYAISVKEPWASLIVFGGKDMENRSHAFLKTIPRQVKESLAKNVPVPLAIHASQSFDKKYRSIAPFNNKLTDPGSIEDAILINWGEQDFRISEKHHGFTPEINTLRHGYSAFSGRIIGTVHLVNAGIFPESKWSQQGCCQLKFENAFPLSEQIDAKGKLGLWKLTDHQIDDIKKADNLRPLSLY